MGGLRALATAALYLVLLSNGFPYSKIRLKKFGFSSKSVPANIVQKLSAYSLLKSDFFRISTSLTNAPRSLSQAKVIHTRRCSKDRTQRLTRRNRGLPSLGHCTVLSCQRNSFYSATLLYTYISRFSVNPHHRQREKIRQGYSHKFYPPTVFSSRFLTSLTHGSRSLSQAKVGTPSAFGEKSHTRAYTPKQGAFRVGWYHYPRHELHVRKPPRAGYQEGVLCRF